MMNDNLLKKLNNGELKDINGGFYFCIVNNNLEDATVLPVTDYEDEVVNYLGAEWGFPALYIVNFLIKNNCEMHVRRFNEEREVGYFADCLWRLN